MILTIEACEGNDDNDYRDSLIISVHTKDKVIEVGFYDGEAEDNSISRNFNDVYAIEDLIAAAYTAGKEGEDLEVVYN